jgi:hypothetical protein
LWHRFLLIFFTGYRFSTLIRAHAHSQRFWEQPWLRCCLLWIPSRRL